MSNDNEVVKMHTLSNWRVMAYGTVLVMSILATAVLVNVEAPNAPVGAHRCAVACGEKAMLKWTAAMEHWMERRPDPEPDVYHPPTPEVCECKP